jgi:hypothetical protein
MQSSDPEEKQTFPFAGEHLKRYEANLARTHAIKKWRTIESELSRPSSLADYFRAHGLCPHCHGIGLAMNENEMGYRAVGWDGDTQLFEECGFCVGTGILTEKLCN